MTIDQNIRRYQQACHENYSTAVGLPEDYRYPTGNPIRPVPAVNTRVGGLMIIGAYPSARFERRLSQKTGRRRLIPIADNLQPFGTEVYFDGIQVRRLESAAGLRTYLLDPLELKLEDCWITDLVKVFLFKPSHFDSCSDAVPEFCVHVLRDKFEELAERSLIWIKQECELCSPRIVVTLGEEVAKAVLQSQISADRLLSVEPHHPAILNGTTTYCCPHPDGCRRSVKWRNRMKSIVEAIRRELEGSPNNASERISVRADAN